MNSSTVIPLENEPISIISSSGAVVSLAKGSEHVISPLLSYSLGYENRAFRTEEDIISSSSSSSSSNLSDDYKYRDRAIPESIVLSWKDLSILTKKNTTLIDNVKSLVRCRSTEYKSILRKVQGIVEPGEMLALMGPRLSVILQQQQNYLLI